ncbi:MAG TPA: hypothetical protein QF446_11310 [Planctomycetota bacterium]|nr:hypothetical protein [Planctomycetota bacterium]
MIGERTLGTYFLVQERLARSAWDHVRVIEAHVLGASLHRGKEALQSCPRESDIAAQATQPFPLRRPAAPFEGPAL